MDYFVRDPNNPRIMNVTSVDPSSLASPLDLQTDAAREADAERRKAERAYAVNYGPLPLTDRNSIIDRAILKKKLIAAGQMDALAELESVPGIEKYFKK